ncbi:hypothetical protein L3X38_017437 [Prunus dulcis]|uniref:Uncharacterized protein n=1 Tax=Prunus dulcis TaxID=3755 RepID=A0AAD4ZA22_PRUDU|nr:hypothetical protein L3X38_017437 [Prunus dulcis]
MKLPHVSEFKDQTPRMLRKDNEALGNTLVAFTNKNNGCLQHGATNLGYHFAAMMTMMAHFFFSLLLAAEIAQSKIVTFMMIVLLGKLETVISGSLDDCIKCNA